MLQQIKRREPTEVLCTTNHHHFLAVWRVFDDREDAIDGQAMIRSLDESMRFLVQCRLVLEDVAPVSIPQSRNDESALALRNIPEEPWEGFLSIL